jgi:cytochrome c2
MLHKRINLVVFSFINALLFFSSCQTNTDRQVSIATDSLSIATGQTLFARNCSSCHNFRQDGIGPNLSGVTNLVSADWLQDYIKNPKSMIDKGDTQAVKLYHRYHTIMPSFAGLPDKEIQDLIAYLHTRKAQKIKEEENDPLAIKDPIPMHIASSGLKAALKEITQIPHSSEKQPYTRIAKMDTEPNTGALFIMDQRGKLYKLDQNQPVVYLDMAQYKPRFINEPGLATGFGSFAFHPDFAKNGLLYTTHTESPGSGKADFGYDDSIKLTLQWVLCEWKTDHPGSVPFKGTCRELLRVNMVSGIHGVQEISFDPLAKRTNKDYGLLYMGIGDGGSVENGYPFLVHRLDKIWGTIIRIDPKGKNSRNGKYGIPADNPFVKSADPETVKEIYAYGFRNPNKLSWTRSGQMIASHIGQANIESLELIAKGHDYGWPEREGNFALQPAGNINRVYALPPDDSSFHYTYPVAEYDHDEGKAIAGGYEYSGKAVPQLKGKYFFGDIPAGRLFYVNVQDLKAGKQAPIYEWHITLNGKPATLHDLCGSDRIDLKFGRDSHGELYIFTKADGKVYKVVNQ